MDGVLNAEMWRPGGHDADVVDAGGILGVESAGRQLEVGDDSCDGLRDSAEVGYRRACARKVA